MKSFSKLTLVFAFILSALDLSAGPTIIRDNRVTDLATTPVLGRGYSIGTNTFQSTCMEKVVITEPSYDMKYEFTQLEDKSTEKEATSALDSTDSSTSERKSRKSSKTSASLVIGYFYNSAGASGEYSSTRSGLDTSMKSVSKSTVVAGKTYYSHSMMATIYLYSYYASVDESRSKLSSAAKRLLRTKDLPGFFSACGPYYVRSIGRKAIFVSIFTYQSESQTRDESFEDELKSEVSSFSTEDKTSFKAKAVVTGFYNTASVETDKRSASQRARDEEEHKRKQEFNSKSSSYRLTINTSAYGLGKDKKATLISFDMESFKIAVKDAYMSMQSPTTGKVSSIEVVPWVENTEFQALVPLEEEEIPEPVVEGETEEVADNDEEEKKKKPKMKLLYEKKHTLNQNAEFFMEIERADRNKMNMYYKVRLCKKNIDMNFKDGDSLKGEYAEALLINHRGGESVTLEFLDQKLTNDFVKAQLKKETDFMYGPDEETPGAAECMRQIMTEGIFKKSYREIEVCRPILEQLGDVQSDLIENFCMPEIASY